MCSLVGHLQHFYEVLFCANARVNICKLTVVLAYRYTRVSVPKYTWVFARNVQIWITKFVFKFVFQFAYTRVSVHIPGYNCQTIPGYMRCTLTDKTPEQSSKTLLFIIPGYTGKTIIPRYKHTRGIMQKICFKMTPT